MTILDYTLVVFLLIFVVGSIIAYFWAIKNEKF